MRWQMLRVLLMVAVVVGWSGGAVQSQLGVFHTDAPVGSAITYQGWLQHNGTAVEGLCDLRFTLFNAASGGAMVGAVVERPNHTVTGGYFTVNDLDFGAAFGGEARWIEVAVRCPAGSGDFTTLTPRQPLTPAPYALYSVNNWALSGNGGTKTANFIGTTDAVTLTFRVSNTVALRLLPNATAPGLVGGFAANSVNPGVLGAVIAGGGGPNNGTTTPNRVSDDYGVIGGGAGNQAGDNAGTTSDHAFATVGGGDTNTATAAYTTISGGKANAATMIYGTVGGGVENNALAIGATVAGGAENSATGDYATVGGGIENAASALYATVSGGSSNDASGEHATVGGGSNNSAAVEGTVAGGKDNQAGGGAAVGGGSNNLAGGTFATIGGGGNNVASGPLAVIAGGGSNQAQGNRSTVGGGQNNIAGNDIATIAGGNNNQATGYTSSIAGGSDNIAAGHFSTISGGVANEVSGGGGTIGGGTANRVSAPSGTVTGGRDAHASHYGEWAYASGGFTDALVGEAQTSIYVLRATTTGDSPVEMTLDGFNQLLTVAEGRTMVFDAQIVARSTAGESAGYAVRGVIENHLGTTAFVGLPTVATLGENEPNWNIEVTASNADDSLHIRVTGVAGADVRWVATVRTTEVQN